MGNKDEQPLAKRIFCRQELEKIAGLEGKVKTAETERDKARSERDEYQKLAEQIPQHLKFILGSDEFIHTYLRECYGQEEGWDFALKARHTTHTTTKQLLSAELKDLNQQQRAIRNFIEYEQQAVKGGFTMSYAELFHKYEQATSPGE